MRGMWDLSSVASPLCHEQATRQRHPLSCPRLTRDTPIIYLRSETDDSHPRRQAAEGGPLAAAAAAEGGTATSDGGENSNSNSNSVGGGGWGSVERADPSADESSPPLCGPSPLRRDVCLLRCDPWSGSLVSLVAQGPRLTLRTAALESDGDDGLCCPRHHHRETGHTTRSVHLSHCANRSLSSRANDRYAVCNVDDEDDDEEEEENEDMGFCQIYSTQWTLPDESTSDVLLTAGSEVGGVIPAAPLFRIGWSGGSHAVALSAQQLHLVDLPGLSTSTPLTQNRYGRVRATVSSIGPVRAIHFDQPPTVSATAMAAYGAQCTLVGFSNGQMHVYDWREGPSGNQDNHQPRGEGGDGDSQRPALTLAAVPQPLWLLPPGTAAARRRRLGGLPGTPGWADGADSATSAGILSCCTIADSWRVVCSLADPRGAVVVADLRKGTCSASPSSQPSSSSPAAAVTATATSFHAAPVSPVAQRLYSRKRSRLTPTELAVKSMLDGHATVITGRAITAMEHCEERFGLLGMVDTHGQPILTSLAALEGGFVNGQEQQQQDSCRATDPVAAVAAASASPPSPWRGTGGGWSSLPSPSDVFHRLRSGRQQPAPSSPPPPHPQGRTVTSHVRSSLGHRCTFADRGKTFVYTHMNEDNCATASFLATGLGARPIDVHGREGDGRTLNVRPTAPAGDPAACSIVSVSALDDVVCLETARGHTVCVLLNP